MNDQQKNLCILFRLNSRALMSENFNAALFPDADVTVGPDALRGIFDRRATALLHIGADCVKASVPTQERPFAAWLAFMDVYGDIVGDARHLDGLRANAKAARLAILDAGDSMKGYDSATAIVAFDFMRRHVADFAVRFPDFAAHMDNPLVQNARQRSAFHILMTDRLDRDGDLLAAVMDDPQAFAHRVADLMQREYDEAEMARLPFLIRGNDDTRLEGYISPSILFEKGREKKRLDVEIRYSNAHRHAQKKALYEQLRKESDPAINRRKIKKKAELIFNRQLAAKKQEHNDLTKELVRHQERVDRFEQELKTIFGEAVGTGDCQTPSLHPSLGTFGYYRVSGRAKDQVLHGRDLVTREEASTILDGLYTKYAQELRRANGIGRRLRAHLLAPRESRLQRDLPEGALDPSRLTTIMTDPCFDTPFLQRQERPGVEMDTGLTLLVDNSGSMSGPKIALAYLAAERLSFWLSNTGIRTEILGFTTVYGAPEVRGDTRPDTLKHLIYKQMHEPHTPRVTQVMAAMLKADLLQTNIDGEAVTWAYNRLIREQYRRKILMVLSDGHPSGNGDATILRRHLGDVVRRIETATPVEIVGIGIMTDVSRYYANSTIINAPHELLETMTEKLKLIIDNPHQSAAKLQKASKPLRTVAGPG